MDGSPGKRISRQQEDGLEAYRRILTAKLKLWKAQPMTAQEQDDARKMGISVMSGHGCGKTTWAAWCLAHFMTVRPYCKIPCVAPAGTQLRTNLWPEVKLWLRKATWLQDCIQHQAEKIFWKEAEGKEWFAFPRSVNVKATAEEQAETLAGIHADNMLIIVDEASGPPDPVFKPLEGGLTGPINMVILIGNPTQQTGYFIDTHTKYRRDWICLQWDAEESELVTSLQIERMARKYGKDSNTYRIRVNGLPPRATPDTLIPLEWVQAAIDRDLLTQPNDPMVLGIDVGRALGGDDSVILTRKGPVVKEIETFNGANTQELAYWCLKTIQEREAQVAAIDTIGWGAGTYDTLATLRVPCDVLPVNVGESSNEPTRFMRLRDEIWWQLRERFQSGTISIPNNDALVGELTLIKYNFQRSAMERIKIESKQDMRDRGVESPNRADALCLSEYAMRFAMPRAHQPRAWRSQTPVWVG